MEKFIGNYLSQANRDFPLDCETLQYLQDQIDLIQQLGAALGHGVILSGCLENNAHTSASDGLILINRDDTFEILPFEGGITTMGVYVKEEPVSVTSQGYDYPQAYTRRTLASGLGEEHYDWSEFKRLKTPAELETLIDELRAQHEADIAALGARPFGTIDLFAGADIPEGYALCDGRELRQTDYPKLFAALGTTYNRAADYNGNAYTTQSGYFRLPDLRGRFVVGLSNNDEEYALGKAGGSKTLSLKEENLPAHTHTVKDLMFATNGSSEITKGTVNLDGENCPAGNAGISGMKMRCQTKNDGLDAVQYVEHDTKSAGQATPTPANNRPPYYALAYIMRLG